MTDHNKEDEGYEVRSSAFKVLKVQKNVPNASLHIVPIAPTGGQKYHLRKSENHTAVLATEYRLGKLAFFL